MKKIIRLILFTLLFTFAFLRVNEVLVHDNNTHWKVKARNQQILSKDFENVDAVFIGGSRMQVALAPMVLWEETGIVSYNLATNSQPPLMTRLILERFIDEIDPSVVFMDLPGILSDADPDTSTYNNNYVVAFQMMDSSEHKKEALAYLAERYPDFDLLMYRYPFYKDHSRWKMLKKADFMDISNYHDFLMGGVNEQALSDHELNLQERDWVEAYEKEYTMNANALEDYLQTIELLKSKGIDVVLVVPPFAVNFNEGLLHAITDFAEEQDLHILDYNLSANFNRIGFRDKNDFYDNGHVSITGSYKFTKTLAEDIEELVEIKEKTAEEEKKLKAYWEAYQDYYAERAKAFE